MVHSLCLRASLLYGVTFQTHTSNEKSGVAR